ncbi:MAG: preprotein translocase subunit SecG [Verrucomicrobiota bacterium]
MGLAIGLFTLLLVVIAAFLCLLILLQLPKKEAGVAAAFGAEQTAALFGAGSGTALSNITRWSATSFLGLCLLIAVMTAHHTRSKVQGLKEVLKNAPAAASSGLPTNLALPTVAAPTSAPAATPAPAPAPTPAPGSR